MRTTKNLFVFFGLFLLTVAGCGGSGSSSSGGPSHTVTITVNSCSGIFPMPLRITMDGRPFDGGLAHDGDTLSERGVSQGTHVFRITDRNGGMVLQNTPFVGKNKHYPVNCRVQPLWE